MSKPVKQLITRQYRDLFEGVSGAVLVDIRGIQSNATNELRGRLAQKQIRVTVVKNSLARLAFRDTELQPLGDMLEGSNALVYPTDADATVVTVARELIDLAKVLKQLQFRGALMEGIRFGPDQIEDLSKYPTRAEAQAQVIQLLLSPAQRLVGQVLGPARRIAACIKAVEERHGEAA